MAILRPRSASMVVLMAVGVLVPVALNAAQAPATQKKQSETKKKAAPQASLSGCIDQQDGHYVLVDDRALTPVADLEADGFPTEGFAKYMGQKVTVRGTSNPGSTRQAFKVRSVETISETCAPAAQSQKK